MRLRSSKVVDTPPADFQHKLPISAPIAGALKSIEQVSDPVIALRAFGEGAALEVTGQQVFSPVEGEITEFIQHCQYMQIRAKNGLKLQIGFVDNIAAFMGERFVRNVKVGQAVSAGDCLFTFDLNLIKSEFPNPTMYMTIRNAQRAKGIVPNQFGRRLMPIEDVMMTLYI